MNKVLHGKVNGRTIEFSENLGLSDGQEVEVQVRALPKAAPKPGDGLLRTEGALVDDTEWQRRPQGVGRQVW